MQKKSKSVLTAVVTDLFVLSIGYFALLSPTTAWFYQDASQTYSFQFADFDVEQEANIEDLNLEFRAATRFADAGEVLFDEVARVVKVEVTNNSTQKAMVRAQVTQNNPAEAPGLRWFFYNTSVADEIKAYPDAGVPAAVGTEKGPYKQAIEAMLTAAGSPAVTYNGESDYYVSTLSTGLALQAHNKQGVSLEPGETRFVYIVLWVEYGDVYSTLHTDEIRTLRYDLNVSCIAEPYHAEKATITVVSPATLDILYTEQTDAEAQTIHLSSGTNTIEGTVGAQFRITIVGNGYVYDAQQTDGSVSARNSKLLTGSVNSKGNTVTIVSAS